MYEEADEYCPHCDNQYVSAISIKQGGGGRVERKCLKEGVRGSQGGKDALLGERKELASRGGRGLEGTEDTEVLMLHLRWSRRKNPKPWLE
jgi:hypothetical protein